MFFAETPEFANLGVQYDVGYIHFIEPVGDVQRHDQAWLGELQLRHHKNKEMVRRMDAANRTRRKEFEGMTDRVLCENYFSGALSENPSIEVVAKGATVTGYYSEEPVRVRPSGLLDMPLSRTSD
jgi:hypothetical protein